MAEKLHVRIGDNGRAYARYMGLTLEISGQAGHEYDLTIEARQGSEAEVAADRPGATEAHLA
jgi:hypothetical protein